MSEDFELSCSVREDMGKGASRRLRRLADLVPAIIYGAGKDPQPLTLVRKDFEKALENEAFFSQIITIQVGGSGEKAILKDLQRHRAAVSLVEPKADRVAGDYPGPLAKHDLARIVGEDQVRRGEAHASRVGDLDIHEKFAGPVGVRGRGERGEGTRGGRRFAIAQ